MPLGVKTLFVSSSGSCSWPHGPDPGAEDIHLWEDRSHRRPEARTEGHQCKFCHQQDTKFEREAHPIRLLERPTDASPEERVLANRCGNTGHSSAGPVFTDPAEPFLWPRVAVSLGGCAGCAPLGFQGAWNSVLCVPRGTADPNERRNRPGVAWIVKGIVFLNCFKKKSNAS